MSKVNRDTRYVMAAVQGIVGWEWLTSGASKVLSGTFPSGLASTLDDGMKGNPNGWYVAFLQQVILPHSIVFGYAIEIAEVLVAVVLLCGALLLIGGPPERGQPQYRLAVAQVALAALAGVVCAFLCVNFHFFMGDGILPGINPSQPFNEGVSLDTLMPPIALLIVVCNLYLLGDMSGVSVLEWSRRAARRVRSVLMYGRGGAPAADTAAS